MNDKHKSLSKLCNVLGISAMKKIKGGEKIAGKVVIGSLQF